MLRLFCLYDYSWKVREKMNRSSCRWSLKRDGKMLCWLQPCTALDKRSHCLRSTQTLLRASLGIFPIEPLHCVSTNRRLVLIQFTKDSHKHVSKRKILTWKFLLDHKYIRDLATRARNSRLCLVYDERLPLLLYDNLAHIWIGDNIKMDIKKMLWNVCIAITWPITGTGSVFL